MKVALYNAKAAVGTVRGYMPVAAGAEVVVDSNLSGSVAEEVIDKVTADEASAPSYEVTLCQVHRKPGFASFFGYSYVGIEPVVAKHDLGWLIIYEQGLLV